MFESKLNGKKKREWQTLLNDSKINKINSNKKIQDKNPFQFLQHKLLKACYVLYKLLLGYVEILNVVPNACFNDFIFFFMLKKKLNFNLTEFQQTNLS